MTDTDRFTPEYAAQVDLGLSRADWGRFVEAAGLTIFTLPGGAHVVERAALRAAIERLALPLTVPARQVAGRE